MNDRADTIAARLADEEEPLIDPQVASFWLVDHTQRAFIDREGNLKMRPDRPLDPLGVTALAIVRDGEPKRFSDVYSELNGEKSRVVPDAVKILGSIMLQAYNEANSNGNGQSANGHNR
jgi:hypothetical protein